MGDWRIMAGREREVSPAEGWGDGRSRRRVETDGDAGRERERERGHGKGNSAERRWEIVGEELEMVTHRGRLGRLEVEGEAAVRSSEGDGR